MTRRCSERRFFLRPSKVVNQVFLYVLAVAARRHGVLVHAFCVLSNHYHLLVTDPEARLPAFMQYLDSLVARAMNASLRRWEGFWSSDASYSAVAHDAPDDVVRKAAYVLANPVSAGLVERASDWPGLWSAPAQLGAAPLVASRPEKFFRAHGDMPATAELALTVPAGFHSAEAFRESVVAAMSELEARARAEARAKRQSFIGRARVMRQEPTARPRSAEPRGGLSPRVAALDKWRRVEALSRLVDFLRDYRAAWAALKAGVRDVLFPAGTYLLRIVHGVRCAELG